MRGSNDTRQYVHLFFLRDAVGIEPILLAVVLALALVNLEPLFE